MFYSHFAAAGLEVAVEDSSSHGRLDMAVHFRGSVYLSEFKVAEMAPEGAAMDQLKRGARIIHGTETEVASSRARDILPASRIPNPGNRRTESPL